MASWLPLWVRSVVFSLDVILFVFMHDGQVGAGKSSLISAMLGQSTKLDGRVETVDSIAYVAQQAWIQNATVKNNILFGREMDWNRYHEIVCSAGSRVCGDGD